VFSTAAAAWNELRLSAHLFAHALDKTHTQTKNKKTGSHHWGSHAFDAPHVHARVITAGPAGASFDEVAARLTEELAAVGLGVVCAVTGRGGGEGNAVTLPPLPPGGEQAGRVALMVAVRTGGDAPPPPSAPVSTAVVCHVFEAAMPDGPALVVQAGKPACPATDAALVSALDALFRLPKTPSPPGTYAWPPVSLPPQGGAAGEAAAKAAAQVARERARAGR
jgi:hypothetical protein